MKKAFCSLCFAIVCLVVQAATPPAPLTLRTTDDYTAFARAFGIVRWYSPNPHIGKWDEDRWINIAALLIERMSDNPAESIDRTLERVFRELAPAATFSTTPQSGTLDGAAPCYYYAYTGSGETHIPLLARLFVKGIKEYKPYYVTRIEATADSDDCRPAPNRIYSFALGDNLWINLPIAAPEALFPKKQTARLLADAAAARKQRSDADGAEKIYSLLRSPAVRIADMTVRWNIVQHFYPYHDEDRLAWEEHLPRMIGSAKEFPVSADSVDVRDIMRYHQTVSEAMGIVCDGHMIVGRNIRTGKLVSHYLPEFFAPVDLICVGNRIVVNRVAPNCKTRLTPGYTITKISGHSANQVLDTAAARLCAGTERARRYRAASELLSALYHSTPLVVEYCNAENETGTDTLRTTLGIPYKRDRSKEPFITPLQNNIYYMNAESQDADEKQFMQEFETLQGAAAVIVDVRGYPNYDFQDILSHLFLQDTDYLTACTPISCFPNREHLTYKTNTERIRAKVPRLTVPLVFLADESTISWGETVLMLVKEYRLGTIVGMPTAGTTGDLTEFRTPIFGFSMTGLRMNHIDGALHHGIGVLPNVAQEYTLSGIRNGRDDILEAAIDWIAKNQNLR